MKPGDLLRARTDVWMWDWPNVPGVSSVDVRYQTMLRNGDIVILVATCPLDPHWYERSVDGTTRPGDELLFVMTSVPSFGWVVRHCLAEVR
jgi:hypothetical protein